MNKSKLRKINLSKRDNYPKKDWEINSNKVLDNIKNLQVFNESSIIHSYLSFRNEVRTLELIQYCLRNHKRVFCPRMQKHQKLEHYEIENLTHLEESKEGILEPSVESLQMILNPQCIFIPGLAFDMSGQRLGFGKGYYDRFLSKQNGCKIGLFFEFQKVEKLQVEKHDVPLDIIITEKSKYIFSKAFK